MDTLGLTPTVPLRRSNSLATSVVVPQKLTLPTKPKHASSFPTTASAASTSSSSSSSQSFPAVDFELISIKPSLLSYTSLRDILPSTAVNSPIAVSPGASGGSYQISIRNRLVKQAAWAYLRPMSSSPDSSGHHFLQGLWAKISRGLLKSPIASFLRCFIRTITRAFNQLLRAFR